MTEKDRKLSERVSQYQPNFVLVKAPYYKIKTNTFGDIVPIYKSYQELYNVIVTSWESFSDFILYSKIFLVCILSLVNEAISNTLYQGYLFLLSTYEILNEVPGKAQNLKKRILETISVVSREETRGLWWIGLKLDIKKIVLDVENSFSHIFLVLKKFYLLFIVGLAILVLNGGLVTLGQGNNRFGVVLNNHSYVASAQDSQLDSAKFSGISLTKQESDGKATPIVDKVVSYKVKEGDSVESIAELYGIKSETIVYNNKITDVTKLPETLSIPWIDAVIYKVPLDSSPEDLEVIYKIDKNVTYSQNEDVINRETGKFSKDTTILLPTSDFEAVTKNEQLEKDRQEIVKKAAEKKTQQNYTAYTNASTYINATSDQRSAGFIWPASGSISRCIQPGHIACDIANNSAPPIFAVKDGIISDVYHFNVVGYGNAVVIDHGNGLRTLYAHMSETYVTPGQPVKQGQAIGRMGCTGFCTGTHVHFEVIINGVKQNPFPYLPPR